MQQSPPSPINVTEPPSALADASAGDDVMKILADVEGQLSRLRAAQKTQDDAIVSLADRARLLRTAEDENEKSRRDIAQQQKALAQEREQLHSQRVALETLTRQTEDQVRAQQDGRPGFLPESNPELATASLIQRLETVVLQASPGNRSCAITNRSPLDPGTRERYTRVVVQVRLRCGTPELATVLHSLESGAPRLFIGNLNILAQRMYFSPGRNEPETNGGLDVSFDLYGYLAPPVEAPRAR